MGTYVSILKELAQEGRRSKIRKPWRNNVYILENHKGGNIVKHIVNVYFL